MDRLEKANERFKDESMALMACGVKRQNPEFHYWQHSTLYYHQCLQRMTRDQIMKLARSVLRDRTH